MDYLKLLESVSEKLKEHDLLTPVVKIFESAKLIEDNGKLVDTSDGKWIPREKMNDIETRHKEVLDVKAKEITDLAKKIEDGGNAAELVGQLKEKSKADSKAYEETTKKMTIDHAVEIEILKAGPTEPEFLKAIKGQLDMTVVSVLETGVVIGVEEQLAKMKDKKSPFRVWFGVKSVKGEPPEDGKTLEQTKALQEAQEYYDKISKQKGELSPEAIAAQRAVLKAQGIDPKAAHRRQTEGT